MANKSESYTRHVWHDRFNTPTVEQLRAALPAAAIELFDAMRDGMNELPNVTETLKWSGDSWRWTIAYHIKDHGDEPVGVIVPSPDDLQFAMPIDREFVQNVPMNRFKRTVRDGLDLAREPYDTRWAVWSLQFPTLVIDLLTLVKMHLEHRGVNVGATE